MRVSSGVAVLSLMFFFHCKSFFPVNHLFSFSTVTILVEAMG